MSNKTSAFVKKYEKRVAAAIKAIGFSATFSVSGHRTRQKNNFDTMRRNGNYTRGIANRVHSDFGSINENYHSMLCVYERSRAMLFLAAYLLNPFVRCLQNSTPVYFVTLVQPQHYTDLGKLSSVTARRVRRKFDDAMRELKHDYPGILAVSTLEISAYEGRDEKIQFHPHVHAVVAGVPRENLKSALVSRRLAKQRSNAKTLHISELRKKSEIAHQLLYITKFAPQLSAPYNKASQYGERSDQPMPDKFKAEWLEWMSNVCVLDIVKIHNFSRAKINKIKTVEMETIIKRFLSVINKLSNRVDG